jgi:hypothetical protein
VTTTTAPVDSNHAVEAGAGAWWARLTMVTPIAAMAAVSGRRPSTASLESVVKIRKHDKGN